MKYKEIFQQKITKMDNINYLDMKNVWSVGHIIIIRTR